jgi:hypothetical protein
MELSADIAQPINQGPFDVHVNVFQLSSKLEVALLNLVADPPKLPANGQPVVAFDNPLLGKHFGVGARGLDVVLREPLVKTDALGKLFHETISRRLEHPAAAQ